MGWWGEHNQRTTKKCNEIKRNLTLTFKTSLENATGIGIFTAMPCKILQHPQINPGSTPG